MHKSPSQLRHEAKRKGFWIIGTCASILAAAVTTMVIAMPPEQDREHGCKKYHLAETQMIVVIDRTDAWSSYRADLITSYIQGMAHRLPTGHRLTLVGFHGFVQQPETPLFDRCKPSDGASVNLLTTTPQAVQRQFESSFRQPLQAALAKLTEVHSAKQSHLVEFLSGLAAKLNFQSQAERSHIVLISDLVENTDRLSFYGKRRRSPNKRRFTRYLTERFGQHFRSLELTLVYVPQAKQGRRFRKLVTSRWRHALNNAGVSVRWQEL